MGALVESADLTQQRSPPASGRFVSRRAALCAQEPTARFPLRVGCCESLSLHCPPFCVGARKDGQRVTWGAEDAEVGSAAWREANPLTCTRGQGLGLVASRASPRASAGGTCKTREPLGFQDRFESEVCMYCVKAIDLDLWNCPPPLLPRYLL